LGLSGGGLAFVLFAWVGLLGRFNADQRMVVPGRLGVYRREALEDV
jgi:hypothetical protein